MKEITINELKQKIAAAQKPLFVKFHTSWCGVCKVNAPMIEEVAKKHNEIEFVAVDADNQKAWAEDGNAEFKVQLVPTYLLYDHGKQVWRKQNFVPTPFIEQAIADLHKSGANR